MTNKNCLVGIACPNCGNDSMLYIESKTLAAVTDDGAETFGDIEWDSDSYTECPECDHRGTLSQFRVHPAEKDPTQAKKE
jgi:hypothetical protein